MEVLVQEARAMELLANEVEIPIDRTQEYWDVSTELISLVSDIDMFAAADPGARSDSEEMLQLRRRLRGIGARLSALSIE